MNKFKVLILTDHTNHTDQNSLYPLVKKMLQHDLTDSIDIVSRANLGNNSFFECQKNSEIFVSSVNEEFTFTKSGIFLETNLRQEKPSSYDLIWLRMPPPLTKEFLDFVHSVFIEQFVINNPEAIYETGSKEFLANFFELCPPLKLCRSIDDIVAFKNQFSIVLKPFREYGGKGIVKIEGNDVWLGKQKIEFADFVNSLKDQNIEFLGVKFLKNVTEGDKRIVVVNGKIMGASLRLPSKGSWICNVAMGGSSTIAEVDEDEVNIIEKINPILSEMGIVMYGVDTLVNDEGKRVLSEINTTSIGGLPQITKLKNLPLLEEAIDLIWMYYLKNKKNAK